jgi:hypothetical protein
MPFSLARAREAACSEIPYIVDGVFDPAGPGACPRRPGATLRSSVKVSVGGLSGFEYVAILAGESRNPAKNIGRSVMLSAPVIALMFILGASSVLTFAGVLIYALATGQPARRPDRPLAR